MEGPIYELICKYLLPCGHCERLNSLCILTEDEPFNFNINCQHEWIFIESNLNGDEYFCRKCGEKKFEPYMSTF